HDRAAGHRHRRAGVPRGLRDIVARCLQKPPDRRFGSAGELIEAFDRIDYKEFDLPPAPPTPGKEKVPTQALAVAPQTPSPVPGRRALVADDDPVARYLIANILAANGFAFDEAANGADAVKCLKQHEYSLIFLDLLMPRIDGWGVLDFMRRMKAE